MPQVKSTTKIHCAAAYFAFVSRDITQIANAFGVNDRTIRRWAEDEEWQTALDACGYTGDRSFQLKLTRDTQRDAGDIFEKTREAYQNAIREGHPKHRWATIAAEAVGIRRRRVHQWAIKHGWREQQ